MDENLSSLSHMIESMDWEGEAIFLALVKRERPSQANRWHALLR